MHSLMKFEKINVNIITVDNQPLFELYSTGMALGHVKYNSKGKAYPRRDRIDATVKNAEISTCVRSGHKYLTESQLYDFMLEAGTNKCKSFKKWVTNEVLPQIRETGGYIPIVAETDKDSFYLQAASIMQKTLEKMDVMLKQQAHFMEENKPKITAYEDFIDLNGTYSFATVAKILAIPRIEGSTQIIGRNTLLSWLRRDGILINSGDERNTPYQRFINQGYFELKALNGDPIVEQGTKVITRVTPKGIEFLYKTYRYSSMPKKLNMNFEDLVEMDKAL